MPGSVPLLRVIRSGVEESVHLGSVAVADADGTVLAQAGDPDGIAFVRSSSKPFQATASLLLAGGGEELTDAEVAVMCGSHNGEPVHLEAVGSILDRAGLGVDALRCPPTVPLDPAAALRVSERRAEYHNCSGKHAGMLLACVRAGLDVGTYPEPSHPVQEAVLDILSRATGVPPEAVGVDGCGVPVHAFPLSAMATMFARLSVPERLGPFEEAARRSAEAMRAQPYLVAGRGRVDTEVMEVVPGTLVKAGAEGLVCASLADVRLGIAVKISDGAGRALGPALLRTLSLLGLLTAEQEDALAAEARPPVTGGGRPVGDLVADFDLAHR